MSLPIACTLSEPERRVRRDSMLATLRAHVTRVTELPDGYALMLVPSDEAIAAAAATIQAERRCCAFLRFTLRVEPGSESVELALTGGPGARELLATWVAPRASAS
jgi:hypothetical protein